MDTFRAYQQARKLQSFLFYSRVQPPTALTFLEDPSQGHCPALIVTEGSQVHIHTLSYFPIPAAVLLPPGIPLGMPPGMPCTATWDATWDALYCHLACLVLPPGILHSRHVVCEESKPLTPFVTFCVVFDELSKQLAPLLNCNISISVATNSIASRQSTNYQSPQSYSLITPITYSTTH